MTIIGGPDNENITMTKTDLAILTGIATLANEKGLIPLEAFQAVGVAYQKAKSALEAMSDTDVMVIQKQQEPLKVDVTSVDKNGEGTEFETSEATKPNEKREKNSIGPDHLNSPDDPK